MRWIRVLMVVAMTWLLSACAPKAELLDDPIVDELREGIERGEKSFDHAAFDALLERHVRQEQGSVDYAALSKEREALEGYLASLGEVNLEGLGRDEQKALLINAYNAATLALIVEHYPGLDSIRDLKDPWSTKRWEVGGGVLSLDDIEHGLLRPLYEDERIHFAVNCASVGCPPLRASAYTGQGLDAQLDEAARSTLNNERYARLEGGELYVTKLMDWYGDDFTSAGYRGSKGSIAEYVAQYAEGDLKSWLEARETKLDGIRPSWIDYDWSLNDVER